MKNHKHYEAARRAHYHTSFTPEKRAEDFCAAFDSGMSELEALGVPSYQREKYEGLVIKHLQAKARCMSSMITGPANFHVRRAEKANNVERVRSLEASKYWEKITKEAKQEAYYAKHPEARPVMAGDSDAVERLQSRLASLIKAQETMVTANKLIRKQPLDKVALVVLLGSEAAVDEILKPDCFGGVGFASFSLTNNNAKIKATRDRIAQLEKRKATEPKELTINGVRVVENTEAMRLQLFFEGKPSPAMIALLKSHAFKWAPSLQAWQRQLTNNAVYSFNRWLLPELKAA